MSSVNVAGEMEGWWNCSREVRTNKFQQQWQRSHGGHHHIRGSSATCIVLSVLHLPCFFSGNYAMKVNVIKIA